MNNESPIPQLPSSFLKKTLPFLVLLSGITILFPRIDFQPFLAQGDHGFNMYAFDAVRQGQLPYKDFWWCYGPLMLYYYAFMIAILGVSIKTVLIAKLFIILFSGLIVFLTLRLFISPILSFIAALWFYVYQTDFYYTYNHVGGILAIFAVFYSICLYIKEQRVSHLYAGLLYAFLLCLIKLNFGLVALLMIFISRIAIDLTFQKKQPLSKIFYALNCIIVPVCVFLVYANLLIGLSAGEIRQCLPYLGGDQFHSTAPSTILSTLWETKYNQYSSSWPLRSLILIFFICFLSLFYQLKKYSNKKEQYQIISFLILSTTFYILNLHEYLLSGVAYRLLWPFPLEILFLFFVIGIALGHMSRVTRISVHLFLIIFLMLQVFYVQIYLNNAKVPEKFLSSNRTKVYISNSVKWIMTVQQTIDFISGHLQPQEKFLAFPYDPIYYYLTDRISPTRQLIFFNYTHIPPEQEKNIIQDLEDNNINWIILSNRVSSTEAGLGRFGKSYCPLLYQYMKDNFERAAQFGDWSHEPGWIHNHGTRILKRIGYKPTDHEE